MWGQIKELFSNYVLLSTVTGWFVAQFLKTIVTLVKDKRFTPKLMLFSLGGMPSSHTATVCSLFTASAIKYGFGSFEFAISFVLALVVMTDAVGVRRETGEQAKVLNHILEEMFSRNQQKSGRALKELVGHTPFQVAMGAVVGICTGIIMGLICNMF